MSRCRACGTEVTRSILDLGLSPLANSYIPMDHANDAEKFYPLHVKVCDSCSLVQLDDFESPQHIFSAEYAYFSSLSDSWVRHAKTYTEEMIERFGFGPDAHVVEIASNDGYLLQWFVQRGIPVTGIEPAGNCAAAAIARGIPTEVTFFGSDTARVLVARRGRADLMVANNVLAHVPDIGDFIGGFHEMLAPQGVITFEFPYLLNLILFNQFDTIYHEHRSYLALGPVVAILEAQELRPFDVVSLPTHGGSLRLFACHRNARHAETPAVAALRAREAGLTNPETCAACAARVIAIKERTWEFLTTVRRAGKTVCGYGAPAKGNTFLNYCGIRRDNIPFTVDRNPAKQNTLLPGSRIPVLEVADIERRKPDYVFILPWNLKDEIAHNLAGIREWGGRFVTAIPQLEIF